MTPETTRFWPSAHVKPRPAPILGYQDSIPSEDFQTLQSEEETGRKECVCYFQGINLENLWEFFLTTVTFGCLIGGYQSTAFCEEVKSALQVQFGMTDLPNKCLLKSAKSDKGCQETSGKEVE